VHSPKALKQINHVLSQLAMDQMEKTLDTFFPNQKGLNRPKNYLTLLSLQERDFSAKKHLFEANFANKI
jgi:hypothetical protein